MNNLLSSISNELLKVGALPTEEVPTKCDWVNKFRASGAEAQVTNIFGNTLGFIQEYWYIIILVFMTPIKNILQR